MPLPIAIQSVTLDDHELGYGVAAVETETVSQSEAIFIHVKPTEPGMYGTDWAQNFLPDNLAWQAYLQV